MWQSTSLGEIISLDYGFGLPKAKRKESGGIPVLGSNGICGHHDQARVSGPGIVVGRKGSAGLVTWVEEDFWPIDTTYYVTPKVDINLKWVYYLLRQLRLDQHKTSTGVPGLNRNDVYGLNVSVPPRSEQRRIVEILDQADALRKQRAEADKKAARILPALFYRMFGDPASNDRDWDIVRGREIFSKIGYGVGSPPPFSKSGIPFLRAGNIKPGGIRKDNLAYFSDEHARSIARSRVHQGDVVIVRRGAYTGDCAVIPEEFDGAYVGYDLICKPSRDTNPYWFAAAWNYPTIWQRIENMRSRAAQQGLNKQQIESFKLPRPPKEEQDKFEVLLRSMYKILRSGESGAGKLDILFDALLHRAFSGELTAKWREAHMKELLQEMEHQAQTLGITHKAASGDS